MIFERDKRIAEAIGRTNPFAAEQYLDGAELRHNLERAAANGEFKPAFTKDDAWIVHELNIPKR